jgi:hypothetical protein
MKSFNATTLTIQAIILSLIVSQTDAAVSGGGFTPRIPVVCQTTTSSSSSCPSSSSSSLSSYSSLSLQLSGGGDPSEHDSDDELLAYAEESDIIIEIRGGSTMSTGELTDGNASITSTTTATTPQQPLRISTYRKGIRQLKNSERRELRRQKREQRVVDKMEKKKERQDMKSHLVHAKKLKVS